MRKSISLGRLIFGTSLLAVAGYFGWGEITEVLAVNKQYKAAIVAAKDQCDWDNDGRIYGSEETYLHRELSETNDCSGKFYYKDFSLERYDEFLRMRGWSYNGENYFRLELDRREFNKPRSINRKRPFRSGRR